MAARKPTATWGHMTAAEKAFRDRLATNRNIPEGVTIPKELDRWIWDALGAAITAAAEYELTRTKREYDPPLILQFRPEALDASEV